MLTEMCNELQQIRQTLQQQLHNEEQNKPNNVTDKLTF